MANNTCANEDSRCWQSIQTSLGLADDDDALDAWLTGPLHKSYWDLAYSHCLDLRTRVLHERAPPIRFTMVQRRLHIGESQGRCSYSRDGPNTDQWDAIDWRAYYLIKTRQANCNYREGVFFGKHKPDEQINMILFRLFQHIQHELQSTKLTLNRSRRLFPHQADPRPPPDLRSGSVEVIWTNTWLIPRGTDVSGRVVDRVAIEDVGQFRTLVEFHAHIATSLHLLVHKLQIESMEFVNSHDIAVLDLDTWPTLLELAGDCSKPIKLALKCALASFPSVGLPLPVTNSHISDPDLDIGMADATREHSDVDESEDMDTRCERAIVLMDEEAGEHWCAEDRYWVHLLLMEVHRRSADDDDNAVVETPLAGSSSLPGHVESVVPEVDDNGAIRNILKDITPEERELFARSTEWMDNLRYQREDYGAAIQDLGIVSPSQPRIQGMPPSAILKKHQVVAIKGLRDFIRSPLGGGILADMVGLGKTWVAIGLILTNWNEHKAKSSAQQPLISKPTLILMPTTVMSQWIDTIRYLAPELEITAYHGSESLEQPRVTVQHGRLTRQHALFDSSNIDNARRILISSYQVLNRQHGFNAFMKSCEREVIEGQTDEERYLNWDSHLHGSFDYAILDEGHFIKSGPSSRTWCTIKSLQVPHVVALTASPAPNRIDDIAGVLGLTSNGDYLWSEAGRLALGIDDPNVNPFELPEDAPGRILCATSRAFEQYVIPVHVPMPTKGKRAGMAFEKCMIKRGYASRIPFHTGPRIADEVPSMKMCTMELRLTARQAAIYTQRHNQALPSLVFVDSEGLVRWRADVLWELCHLPSWLAFSSLKEFRTKDVRQFRQKGKTLEDLIALTGLPPPRILPETTDVEARYMRMHWVAVDSPKLRILAHIVAHFVVLLEEKMIIYCGSPQQQLLIELFIRESGVEARSFHSALLPEERTALVTAFHQDRHGFPVLVLSYQVSTFGLNLHGFCRTVVLFEPPSSKPRLIQCIGRVRRMGQTREQHAILLHLLESWNDFQQGHSTAKGMPELYASLNLPMLPAIPGTSAEDDEDLNPASENARLFAHVITPAGLLLPAGAPGTEGLPPLDSVSLMQHISRVTEGTTRIHSTDRVTYSQPASTAPPAPESDVEISGVIAASAGDASFSDKGGSG